MRYGRAPSAGFVPGYRGMVRGRQSLDALIRSLAPAAWFRQGVGITVTGSGVSQWDDQSGNGRHLLQGTDAARPIDLPFSGTRYLYLPGVAGNYASTPDSVANSINGPMTIVMRLSAPDWTPAATVSPIGKAQTNTTRSWYFQINTLTFTFFSSPDGTAASQVSGAIGMGSSPFTDGDAGWLRVDFTPNDGAGNRVYSLYKAADQSTPPTSWTQIGSTTTTAGTTTIHDNNSEISIGGLIAGTAQMWPGKIYRAIIKNGIDGTTVVDFNPADADGDGDTSFASSTTGETWTINSSGGLPAQIVGRPAVLFNGTAHYLKTNAFTLNQPEWVLWVGKQVSWTSTDDFIDGNTNASMLVRQLTTTPNIGIFAGTGFVQTNPDLSIGSLGVVSAVFNGANSAVAVNLNANVTGNAGASNAGGLTLGANATPGNYSNISTSELIVFPFAPTAEQQSRIIAGLMARHGVT